MLDSFGAYCKKVVSCAHVHPCCRLHGHITNSLLMNRGDVLAQQQSPPGSRICGTAVDKIKCTSCTCEKQAINKNMWTTRLIDVAPKLQGCGTHRMVINHAQTSDTRASQHQRKPQQPNWDQAEDADLMSIVVLCVDMGKDW